MYCDGLSIIVKVRVLHSPRILILSYDGGHRRVSAISFCLPFDLVSWMVAEKWSILEVQEWNGGFVFEVPNVLGHYFLFNLVL